MDAANHNPLRNFATDVVRRLSEAGFVALWAGGCVRDFMLGRVPQDYDVATDARPEQVRELFGRRRTYAVGESFGVVIVRGPTKQAGQIEVATFRTEGEYGDGRHPDSVTFCTPEEDAGRRDFTINGMFYDPLNETLHDYVGGEADLGQGIVRAIGNPRDRMTEDKLRMLRAVRFTSTLDFQLDGATADAVRDMAGEILVVSWERITQELRKMLVDKHRERAIRLCHELGLLKIILPELSDVLPASTESSAESQQPSAICQQPTANRQPPTPQRRWWNTLHMLGNLEAPSFELAMAALLHTVPAPIDRPHKQTADSTVRGVCRRLKLSNDETDRIAWLVAHRHDLDEAPALPLAALKRLLVHQYADDLLTLARRLALAEPRATEGIDFAAAYRSTTPPEVLDPPKLLNGTDLQMLGLQPGPQFKKILTLVRDAQLNEQIATPEEATVLARRLVNNL